jgi:undecaprenyl-diphosphatase
MDFDRIGVEWLNEAAVRWAPLEHGAVLAAKDLPIVLMATLVVGGAVAAIRDLRRRELSFRLIEGALVALLALGLGMIANQIVGSIWFRPRPYDAIRGLHLLVAPSPDPSFPSDHATAVLCLAIGIGVAVPWLRNVLLAESAMLLTGRVVVGLHYPSDMAGGLAIALVAVAVAQAVVFKSRYVLHQVAAPAVGWFVPLGPPSPSLGRQGRVLMTAGLFSALVGLSIVLEVAADPVRLHPGWLERTLLTGLWVGLAAVSLLIVRASALTRPQITSS